MSWVFENGPADPSERLVLLALADYASDNGEWSPSMIGIASKAGMTERGARGVVRRLEAGGWIEVQVGGGRGGRSHYRVLTNRAVNPEQQTRNDKPGMINPERGDAKPGTKRPETRNQRSAEPSVTIKEPSLSKTREVEEALEAWASPYAVASFLAYRRKKKGGALSLTGAKRLAGHLQRIFNEGGDCDDALAMAEERGWQSVEAAWYFKNRSEGNGAASQPIAGANHRRPSGAHDSMVAAFARVAHSNQGGPR
jgi:hypothetical protein